jgi:branched-chain amino acid transport system permease protein
VYMVVGGKEKFEGPIVGTVVLSLVSEFTRPVEVYQPMIIGAIAIAVVMLLPHGLAGLPQKFGLWLPPVRIGNMETDLESKTERST